MAVKHCTIAFLIGIFIHHLGTDAQTTTLQVRVAGNGQVILSLYNTPGALCSMTAQDAAVICGSIGAQRYGAQVTSVYLPAGSKIWLNALNCNGNEATVEACPKQTWNPGSCPENRAAAVSCRNNGQGTTHRTTLRLATPSTSSNSILTVRLQGASSELTSGRVVVSYYGEAGRVCAEGFDFRDAKVVCRMLGYSTDDARVRYETPAGGKIWLTALDCRGDEQSLLDCGVLTWSPTTCNGQDAGVICRRGSVTPTLPAGFVRLDGGPDSLHGRVYIETVQGTGSVCSGTFSVEEVAVVCRMLTGSPSGGIILAHLYGPGSGTAISTNFRCRGSETNLNQCPYESGSRRCYHAEDISIGCGDLVGQGQVPFSVSLVGGPTKFQGRVEITYYGQTGTVCDNRFGVEEARIVCRLLNYHGDQNTIRVVGSRYGPGPESTPILLSDLDCRGYENNFADCPNPGWRKHDCRHSQDVSIECGSAEPVTPSPTPTPTPRPSFSQVSLTGGADYKHGILNIQSIQDGWQTVCSNSFSTRDLAVVCRMITGRPTTGLLFGHLYGPGTYQPVWDNFNCRGSETNINQCPHEAGTRTCDRLDAISIGCGNLVFPGQSPVSVALVDGPDGRHGRLVINYYGRSGTVCGNSFGTEEARIVCRMLGYNNQYDSFYVGSQYGPGPQSMPVLLDRLECRGYEATLADCQHSGWNQNTCSHRQDVSIHCGPTPTQSPTPSTTPTPRYSRISLRDGPDYLHGILTIESAQGGVQTVCSNGFSAQDLAVVCRMLTGRSTPGLLLQNLYGLGRFQIVSLNFRCRGSETNLNQCPYDTGSRNCYPPAGISISCGNLVSNQAPFSVSLVGGPTQLQGRLQVSYYGQVGTVCNNLFGVEEARVVCRSLGYYDPYDVYVGSDYGSGPDSMPILLDRLICTGSESTFAECQSSGWGTHSCTHRQDVSIQCGRTFTQRPTPSTTPTPTYSRISLTGGPDYLHGILTIESAQGGVQTVCSNSFSAQDLAVVCRMLTGRSTSGLLLGKLYGRGQFQQVPLNFRCRGSETNLNQCPYETGSSNCYQQGGISISCGNLVSNQAPFSMSLVGGPTQLQGRLQVTYYGQVGTVCNNLFGVEEARVVCRSLGYYDPYSVYVGSDYGPGPDSMPILLDRLTCTGSESMLSECQSSGWGTHSCTHRQDVSIQCGRTQTPQPTQPPVTIGPGNAQVSLVKGPDRLHGILTIKSSQGSGTVCNSNFGAEEANVVCRMLTGRSTDAVLLDQLYGPGTGPVVSLNIDCRGTEFNINQCPYGGRPETCRHSQDISIGCGPLGEDFKVSCICNSSVYCDIKF